MLTDYVKKTSISSCRMVTRYTKFNMAFVPNKSPSKYNQSEMRRFFLKNKNSTCIVCWIYTEMEKNGRNNCLFVPLTRADSFSLSSAPRGNSQSISNPSKFFSRRKSITLKTNRFCLKINVKHTKCYWVYKISYKFTRRFTNTFHWIFCAVLCPSEKQCG